MECTSDESIGYSNQENNPQHNRRGVEGYIMPIFLATIVTLAVLNIFQCAGLIIMRKKFNALRMKMENSTPMQNIKNTAPGNQQEEMKEDNELNRNTYETVRHDNGYLELCA
jgi:hypothetical protein